MSSVQKAHIVNTQVRCGTHDCEGKFGTLLGSYFKPERGWKFTGGTEEGGRLVGVTYEPTREALRGWSRANTQVALDLVPAPDKERLCRRIAEGLNSFSRQARMTDGFVADRRLPGLPALVRCYVCGKTSEVEAVEA